MRGRGLAAALAIASLQGTTAAQSSHLSALESSRPAGVVEPTAGTFNVGLGTLWSDPTTAPRAAGGFFSISQSSFSGVRVFQAALAFRVGPRWSLAYGSAEIGDLFDTSLTNQDPALANLRARAVWAGADATVLIPRGAVSVGLAIAGDENVGDVHSSTVARVSARIYPLGGAGLALGFHGARAVGGSIDARAPGRQSVDVMVNRQMGTASVSLSAAVSRGALWRYSETRGGVAAAANVNLLSRLDLGLGVGRYKVGFGARNAEWYRSATAGILLQPVRVNVRYTSTELGLGSGYAVSLGYEPR